MADAFEMAKFLCQKPLFIENGISFQQSHVTCCQNTVHADPIAVETDSDSSTDTQSLIDRDLNLPTVVTCETPWSSNSLIRVYPTSGQQPLSIFTDQNSEELTYPELFCGEARVDNSRRRIPVSYSTIAQAELKSSDRRWARHEENLFWKATKLKISSLFEKLNVVTRKRYNNLTAKDLSEDSIKSLFASDRAYAFTSAFRNSPEFF